MTIFRHSSLIAFSGRFRPVLHEDLERRARDYIEDPVFSYPHHEATVTSWESLLDVASASKDEVVENARGMLRLVSFTRKPGAYPGFHGGAVTAAHARPSSRGSGAMRIPGFSGEGPVKPTVSNCVTVVARSGSYPRTRFSP